MMVIPVLGTPKWNKLTTSTAPMDIGIRVGRIVDIAPQLTTDAPQMDAGGGLIIRGFVDSHLNLDKTCILDRAQNQTGTLKGALDAVTTAKRAFTAEDVYARGARVLENAIG
ncbi:amidohydrolase family protein [Salipiger aestuarii]|uniref:hypothetical protein n=1 Tax=Salipiger aestuarii TaxID=568098 RepID=UPI001CC2C2F0|nr:hypothetical protein [Salipiger aestuarii]